MNGIDAVSSLMSQLNASEVFKTSSEPQTASGAVQQVLDQQHNNLNVQFGVEALKLSLSSSPVGSLVNILA